jgi:precorrin-6B methylase 1
MSAQEAYMRLFSHPIVRLSHTVYKLVVHKENEARIVIPGDADEATIKRSLAQGGFKKTQLSEFIKLCAKDEEARQYSYEQIGRFYSWNGEFFYLLISLIMFL